MSTNMIDEPLSESYEFYDAKQYIVVTLYANGSFETKDVEVSIETDSLEIRTPLNERWSFQLYEHIYSDRSEIETKSNGVNTQTSIEIRLYKQQTRTTWPQLYTFTSFPITPQRYADDCQREWLDCDADTMSDHQPLELTIKKLSTDFHETNERFTLTIYVKQVSNLNVEFNETNFTAMFQTNDETFLKKHEITSDKYVKLFSRVKERIVPTKCLFKCTSTTIEIILIKDNPHSMKWGRVEPCEYSEARPLKTLTPLSTPPSSPISTPPNRQPTLGIHSNNAIPLPPPLPLTSHARKSDKYPSATAFSASIERKDGKSSSLVSSSSIGFTGIHNPANSCFMNAAVQCLSNTRELRDYFLNNQYISEINRTNSLGMKGVMAEEFANLMKNLWSGKYNWTYANGLRDYAAKRHQEFVGHGQHDAQELLTILLDAIHEDLNRITNKPQVPPVEDQGRPDDIVADEFWRGYLSRNDSIIVQLFTGQFKSKTKCPACYRESVTFDPFTSLSVPIPKRTAIDTIVIFRSGEKPPIKFRIIMSADGLVSEFQRLLANKCGLPANKMIVYKIRGSRTIDYLKDDERVTSTGYSMNNNSDLVYVAETLTTTECNNEQIYRLTFVQRIFKITDYVAQCGYCQAPPNPHNTPRFCNHCYQVFYCDESCQKLHASEHKNYCGFRASDGFEILANPFIISLPESKLNYENVHEQIRPHIKQTIDIQIEHSNYRRRTPAAVDYYDDVHSDPDDNERVTLDDEDTFSDVENVDWSTIKATLSSSDSWSICRLGDYFVKNGQNKRRRHRQQQGHRKEKFLKNNHQSMMINGDYIDRTTTDDEFDILDEIDGKRPLFRLMPLTTYHTTQDVQPILEPGEDAERILRMYQNFAIDWFTDNKREAPLRVLPPKQLQGINGLVEDDSVFDSAVGDQDLNLQQCLQMFIEPEVLGPDDKWYCPTCKEHIQAEKKMSVWRLPPILIVQLKRFKYYHGSSFGYFSDSRMKIDTCVKFPVHDLDMSPYCSSGADSSECRYDLFGVINHRGSAWFGHYTSYARLLSYNDSAKTEIGWRNFDDEHVSTLPRDKELVKPDAYVLFYRHRNLPVNISPTEFVSPVKSPTPMESYGSSATSMDVVSDDYALMHAVILADTQYLFN